MGNRLVGGEETYTGYVLLFLAGVAIGSLLRFVAFLVPTRIVRVLERRLLGDGTEP